MCILFHCSHSNDRIVEYPTCPPAPLLKLSSISSSAHFLVLATDKVGHTENVNDTIKKAKSIKNAKNIPAICIRHIPKGHVPFHDCAHWKSRVLRSKTGSHRDDV